MPNPASPLRPIRLVLILWVTMILLSFLGVCAVLASSAEETDAARLLSRSSSYMTGETSIRLVHRQPLGTYSSDRELEDIGARWAQAFGLSDPQLTLEQGRPTFSAASESVSVNAASQPSSERRSLRIVGMDDGTLYAVVRAELSVMPDGVPSDGESLLRRLSPAFSKLGIEPHWNIMIQGTLTDELSPEAGALQARLARELRAAPAESYEDARTYSWSYDSPRFGDKVVGPARALNVQVAVHQMTGDDRWRITWGLPLITAEY